MSNEDAFYYHRRAEEEIELASRSTDGRLVAFHYQLGTLYLERVFGPDAGPDNPGEAA